MLRRANQGGEVFVGTYASGVIRALVKPLKECWVIIADLEQLAICQIFYLVRQCDNKRMAPTMVAGVN